MVFTSPVQTGSRSLFGESATYCDNVHGMLSMLSVSLVWDTSLFVGFVKSKRKKLIELKTLLLEFGKRNEPNIASEVLAIQL